MAVQLLHPIANGGIGALKLLPEDRGGFGPKLLVGAADGSITAFDCQSSLQKGIPLVTVRGAITSLALVPGGGLVVGTLQGDLLR